MLTDFGKKEVLVVGRITPVRLAVSRARRRGGSRGRWRGASELLIEIGGRRRHAGGWGPSHMPLLRKLFYTLVHHVAIAVVGVEDQFLAQYASPSTREAHGVVVAVHDCVCQLCVSGLVLEHRLGDDRNRPGAAE